MSRRNTISREFFATIAAVLVLGLSVMCAIQAALSAAYFIGERKSSLTDVLNGATALSERFADEGSIVTKPLQGEDVLERAHSGFELFNTHRKSCIMCKFTAQFRNFSAILRQNLFADGRFIHSDTKKFIHILFCCDVAETDSS